MDVATLTALFVMRAQHESSTVPEANQNTNSVAADVAIEYDSCNESHEFSPTHDDGLDAHSLIFYRSGQSRLPGFCYSPCIFKLWSLDTLPDACHFMSS